MSGVAALRPIVNSIKIGAFNPNFFHIPPCPTGLQLPILLRRHRGGKVANKMRVLEKKKRREQEKLAKLSQNVPDFIKLSKDVTLNFKK